MPDLPESFLASLNGAPGFDADAFKTAHASGRRPVAVRMNEHKYEAGRTGPNLRLSGKIPWTSTGFYLQERPLFYLDPLWHAGVYYVQDPSSMSLEFVLKNACDTERPLRVLDLCAAPGGKTTLLAGLFSSESLVVANEIISSRIHTLEENVIKWGTPNVVVVRQDAGAFGRMKDFFDVIVVDAPCSGSGLFRKDADAIKEWSPEQVSLCGRRQKRILADVMPALKNNGRLVYSTCSFSMEENEDIADFLVRELGLDNVDIPFKQEWNIVESLSPLTRSKGYRFYPDKLAGEGLFISCFRKGGPSEGIAKKGKAGPLKNIQPLPAPQIKKIGPWLTRSDDLLFFLWRNEAGMISESLKNDLDFLCRRANVLRAGTHIGKFIREKWIPGHGLAMSCLVNTKNGMDLEQRDAVRYLRRESIPVATKGKEWMLATYENYPLGWLKAAGNRVNNYYPMNWRIRKNG